MAERWYYPGSPFLPNVSRLTRSLQWLLVVHTVLITGATIQAQEPPPYTVYVGSAPASLLSGRRAAEPNIAADPARRILPVQLRTSHPLNRLSSHLEVLKTGHFLLVGINFRS